MWKMQNKFPGSSQDVGQHVVNHEGKQPKQERAALLKLACGNDTEQGGPNEEQKPQTMATMDTKRREVVATTNQCCAYNSTSLFGWC